MKRNQLKRVFVLAGLVLMGSQLFAQELFEIKVKLVKSNGQFSNHTTATLLDAKTMEIVAENVSNDNEELIFENVAKGTYILSVQKPGFRKADTRYIIIDKSIAVLNNAPNTFANTGQNERALVN